MDDTEIQRFVKNLASHFDRSSFPVEVVANQMTEHLTPEEGAVFAALAGSYLVQFWVKNMNTLYDIGSPADTLRSFSMQVARQTPVGNQLFNIYIDDPSI